MTAREPELPPVRLADRTRDIQLLVEAREDVVTEMTRVRNRLHADLRVLAPGYGEAGDVRRFRSPDALAALAGVAPSPIERTY